MAAKRAFDAFLPHAVRWRASVCEPVEPRKRLGTVGLERAINIGLTSSQRAMEAEGHGF